MQNSKLRIIYEDEDVLVIDKPANIIVFPEKPIDEKTLIDLVLETQHQSKARCWTSPAPSRFQRDWCGEYPDLKNVGQPPRYGIVHRLDKDTSGIILIAKNNRALPFFQKQFSLPTEASGEAKKTEGVEKKYLALVTGNIKEEGGRIETLIGRSLKNRKKQKVFLAGEPGSWGKRKAITEYKVIKRYQDYTLVEAIPKTGRKHQIRCHFAYLQHPIAGDKLYGFKNQLCAPGLTRHFLHASYLKIKLPTGEIKEFQSELPLELKETLKKLN